MNRPVVGYVILAVGGVTALGMYHQTTARLERTQAAIRVQAEQGARSEAALCAQRDDLERRIRGERRRVRLSMRLLKQTQGPHIFAIPRSLIVQSLQRNRGELRQSYRTRENLALLDCKEER